MSFSTKKAFGILGVTVAVLGAVAIGAYALHKREASRPSHIEAVLKGEHQVRMQPEGYFLRASINHTDAVSFSWIGEGGAIVNSVLPLEKRQTIIDESMSVPIVKFKWRRPSSSALAGDGQSVMDYVIYAVVKGKSADLELK